jgi:replication factor C subunit 3/5
MILWVEKYRPTNFDDVLSNNNTLATLKYFIESKSIPNLLFHGPPGSGKTSTILVMAKKIYQGSYNTMVLELNASDNRNIQVVRKVIREFASTKNMFSTGFKLIILDEVDSMTVDAQFCLRRIIEIYSENVRFCFICNYIGKIIPAIQSRCTRFKFSPIPNQLITKKLDEILKNEKIVIPPNIINTIVEHSRGDMRKIINIIQIYKFHKPENLMTNYFGILNIVNKKYCKSIIDCIKDSENINDIINIRDRFISGFDKGYFTVKSFCSTVFDVIKTLEVDNDSKVKSIIILADIERNEKLLLKNITYDNILINIYQVLQNSKLFKNCKT